jgi:hypothetical protein
VRIINFAFTNATFHRDFNEKNLAVKKYFLVVAEVKNIQSDGEEKFAGSL